MGGSSATESEDGVFSTDSPMSNDGDNIGGSSNGGVQLKRGPWTSAEDAILVDYVRKHGEGNWNAVQKQSGLSRCGKSCRLRWANHLRPNLKKGAFTSNEERLIIELHAKMGNKWARMAAHLPGRTDNEIKNYWNTRIKRRQRAGLPLYPPELCLQENQQQQSSPGIYGGDKVCHDIFQSNCYETPDVMFNSCDNIPSHTPEFTDISASGTTVDGFSYPQFYKFVPQTIGFQKHTEKRDEPMSEYVANEAPLFDRVQPDNRHDHKMSQSLGLSFPFDPDHKKLLPYSVDQDSRFMSNVIFSASKHFSGAQKLELPSLQYHETGLGIWDPPPQSIGSDPLPPHSTPHSSGLLEDLLHEAKALSKSENQSSKTFSTKVNPGDMTDSSAMKTCSMEFKGYMDYSTPSGNSMESIFNGCTLTGSIGSSLEKKIPERNVKSEVFDQTCIPDGEKKEIRNQLECYRPDSLLGSGWVKQSAYFPKQRGSVTDAISALMGDGLGPELNNTSTSTGDLGSCIWNNMPSIYQNREISRPPGGVTSRDN